MPFHRLVNMVEIVALVAGFAFALLLFANEPDRPSATAGSRGAAIYSSTCATCHGATGLGSVGPRLAGRVAARYPDVADQIALVSNGRSGMPSFSDRLSETEIEAVVDYTRTDLAG